MKFVGVRVGVAYSKFKSEIPFLYLW